MHRMCPTDFGGARQYVRGRILLSFVLLFLATGPTVGAAETVDEFVGENVVEVNVRSEGRVVREGSVVELIETRVGIPLSMRQVRESLTHLFSLGEYEDVQVGGRLIGEGVVLDYELVPLAVINRIEFDGNVRISDDDLREVVTAVHGQTFEVEAVATVAEIVRRFYRERGFIGAEVSTKVVGTSRSQQVLLVQVRSGARARIAQIFLRGVSFAERELTLVRLGLRRNQLYDGTDVERRLVDYETELRARRYYQADLSHSVDMSDDGVSVDLRIDVHRGPRITIVFTGDSVSSVDLAELVGVEREGSVDEDLLEDADRRIERLLNNLGYRDASVEYAREADGDELAIVFNVDRGPLYEIAAVTFSGNESVPDATVAELISLTVGTPLIMRELEISIAAISEHYFRIGFAIVYVAPEITPVDAESAEPSAGTVRVTCDIVITEGAKTLIRSVEIDDPEGFVLNDWRSLTTLEAGDPYYVPNVIDDRNALRVRLLNEGFENGVVVVEPQFDEVLEAVDIVYRVNPGTRVIIEHVLIVGNKGIQSETIRREITLVEGSPFSLVDVAETRRRLNTLGVFRRIDIREFSHGGDGLRDVVIMVDEASATRVGYGGGLEASVRLRRKTDQFGSQAVERLEFAPRGFVQIGRGNLWGKNRSIDLYTRVSLRRKNDSAGFLAADARSLGLNEYRVLGTYQEPRVLDSGWDGFVTGFVEQTIRPGFDLFSRGVNAQIIRQLRPGITASIDYGLGQNTTSNKELNPQDEPLVDRLFPQVRLSSFSGSLVRDTRDDEIDPHHGELFTFDAQFAARAIGSELGFAKMFIGAFLYREIPRVRRFVFATGVRVGLVRAFVRSVTVTPRLPPGLDDIEVSSSSSFELLVDQLPLSERFFAGGDTSVRGFALDRLGDDATIDKYGFPLGGNATLILNGELRFSMTRTIDIVGFLDGGNVYDRVSNMSLTRIRGGAGFGVRYQSPVGPIRVDLGFKLDRQEFDNGELERPTALHISIGQAF